MALMIKRLTSTASMIIHGKKVLFLMSDVVVMVSVNKKNSFTFMGDHIWNLSR